MALGIIQIGDDDFQREVLNAPVPVVVEFCAGHSWSYDPLFAHIARKYAGTAKFCALHTDSNASAPATWRVLKIPTILVFRGGAPVARVEGNRPMTDVECVIALAIGAPGYPASAVASSVGQGVTPTADLYRSQGTRLFRRLFRYVLVWTVFWLLLATAATVRLWETLPRTVGLDSGWVGYSLGLVACTGALGFVIMVRQMGAMENLKSLYKDAQWERARTSAERWLTCAFLCILVVPIAGTALLVFVIEVSTSIARPSIEIAGPIALTTASLLFALSLFAWHLRIGQMCGMVGTLSDCPSLERQAKQVVRNWWILLIEMAGLLIAGGYLLMRSGETFFLWTLVLVWLFFVVYCFIYLAALLWRTASVLDRAAREGHESVL